LTAVTVFTVGGPSVGLGHVARCGALSAELVDLGFQVTIVLQGSEACLHFFPVAARVVTVADWMHDPETCRERALASQIALFDCYGLSDAFYSTVFEGFAGLPVFFDDLGRTPWCRGVVINGAPHAASLYPDRVEHALLVGAEYQSLRPDFQDCERRVCSASVKRMVITLGGDDIRSLAPPFFERLSVMPEHWELTFITTGSSRTCGVLRTLVDEPHRLVIDADGATMRREFSLADLAITAAGQTTFETAAVGLPVVVIQVADNQRELVRAWQALGYVVNVLSWFDASSPGQLESAVRAMAPHEIRQLVAAKGQRAIDGRGASRIAKRIKELLVHA